LLAKSSPFGSISHSYADQNTFSLFAFGKPLIITSGHYVAYGSQMHLNWRKQTKSSNTLLIDGLGQFSGYDWAQHHEARGRSQDITAGEQKAKQLAAKGDIIGIVETDEYITITMDATAAYTENVPYLESYVRELTWVKCESNDRGKLVIKDIVKLAQDGCITSVLHGLNPFDIEGDNFAMSLDGVELKGCAAHSVSGVKAITQSDKFDGVEDAGELEGLENQHHLHITTNAAKEHLLTVELEFCRI